MHLATEHRRAILRLCHLLFQLKIVLLYLVKLLVGFCLLAYEHGNILHPFCLSQRVELLISQVWNQRDASLLYGIVAAALKRRNEDNVRMSSHNQFGVEVALLANLHDVAVAHALLYVFAEKILSASNALHHVNGVERS